ncbi:MAG: Maf family protein [Putridiphycobacter sp.]|nr:Maf family protein [Putridiphycobacter sp.]
MLAEKLKDFEIILASQSPRRKELLAGLEIEFKTMSMEVDESFPYDMEVEEVAEYLSHKKAVAYQTFQTDRSLVITADTVVVVDDEILEKPSNESEAAEMLTKLSGRSHDVITGVTIKSKSKSKSFSVLTKVYFKQLTLEEIYHYVHHFKPFDKAGSYGIQEWIGFIGVEKIEGSYFNVMGLPVFEVNKVLMDWTKT